MNTKEWGAQVDSFLLFSFTTGRGEIQYASSKLYLPGIAGENKDCKVMNQKNYLKLDLKFSRD